MLVNCSDVDFSEFYSSNLLGDSALLEAHIKPYGTFCNIGFMR